MKWGGYHDRPSPRLVAGRDAGSKLRSSAPSEHFRLHGVNHKKPSPTAVAIVSVITSPAAVAIVSVITFPAAVAHIGDWLAALERTKMRAANLLPHALLNVVCDSDLFHEFL